jgi:voltage-gated potassium channel
MGNRYRRWIYNLLQGTHRGFGLSRVVNVAIMALILANVLAFMLESFDGIGLRYHDAFRLFEAVSVVLFTLEYLGRLWVAPEHDAYEGPILGRLRWAITPLAIVDLLAVAPFYLRGLIAVDLRALRLLRVLRLVRIVKLARYSNALRALVDVVKRTWAQLVVTLVAAGLMLVLAASLMWIAEGHVQPEVFPNVPATLWWAVVTLTTVGYGDAIPVTTMGKIIGGVIAVLGVAFIALPASILAAGFRERFTESVESGSPDEAEKPARCPHCGEALEVREGE